ncbi:MAG: CPBP family intramembrane glutamic endopeptidase [Pedobacter sp.]|nr:CPBP family intramembrane glutamic endopeptidase [Pedobacter sp.]MDQ8052540.1 CPBP family intramembrane glutamic endopeptidase [Pedobacter sp.]
MPFAADHLEEKQPSIQLLLLGVYVIVGLFVGAFVGFAAAIACYGLNLISDLSWAAGQDLSRVGALKLVLVGQSIGMFLLPALALSLTERKSASSFYGTRSPKANLMLWVLLFMLCSLPISGLITELNAHMHLPRFLRSVEKWMSDKEKEALTITKAILGAQAPMTMLINLLVMAVVPAVAEEFLFRGALQRTLFRFRQNPHFAIWISAFVFSAIHLQFFGFFPRLLLGVAFGYIYFWTGNIWYSIFAHFLNNAYVVVLAFYLSKKNIPLDKADEMDVNWVVYIISAVLTVALLKYLRDRSAFGVRRHQNSAHEN